MKTYHSTFIRKFGLLAAILFCSLSAHADPISIPEKPLTPEITFLVSVSILLEAVCILLLLRHFRKPRWFIVWVLGLHLITYPTFLGLLWLFQNMRPASAVALGESLIVVIEGTLIYLICRFVPGRQQSLRVVSLIRSWLVSLAGNACSFIAFPFLLKLSDFIFRRY